MRGSWGLAALVLLGCAEERGVDRSRGVKMPPPGRPARVMASAPEDRPADLPPDLPGDRARSAADLLAPRSGELTIVTYNVAGLPEVLSQSAPARNIPLIGRLLNGYDLVLVQEDFWYHANLARDLLLPHKSLPKVAIPTLATLGDGLNRWSRFAFRDHDRVPWKSCHGHLGCASDCLAQKGFDFARHELGDGIDLDVYNVHADAGTCAHDRSSRASEYDQLAEYIDRRSAGRAVVVAGDFNLDENDPADAPVLETFAKRLGLRCACDALRCGIATLDRVLVRSGADLRLEPVSWSQPEFEAPDGRDLSDHEPTAVRLRWERVSKPM